LKELVLRTFEGDPACLAQIPKLLDENPQIWEMLGDLTRITEDSWIDRIANRNRIFAETIRRRLALQKASLAGSEPTPLEQMLVANIGLCWLAAHHGEMTAASTTGASLQQATFMFRRAESAQRRLLRAVKTLATIRSLELSSQAKRPKASPAKSCSVNSLADGLTY